MRMRWVETDISGEKQLILKGHKYGWEATGNVWSQELTDDQREQLRCIIIRGMVFRTPLRKSGSP